MFRGLGHLAGMAQKSREIVERVLTRQLTRVNEAHENITHMGSGWRLEKERIPAMAHGEFQGPLADIVVESWEYAGSA